MWDCFLSKWFQGMRVPLGLSGCGYLTLEFVGAEVFDVCALCVAWTLFASLLVSRIKRRDWREGGRVGHSVHELAGAEGEECTGMPVCGEKLWLCCSVGAGHSLNMPNCIRPPSQAFFVHHKLYLKSMLYMT